MPRRMLSSSALTAIRDTIDENVETLGDIDAVAGDGDHGIGMQRGARAAVEAAEAALADGAGAGTVLTVGADAWSDRAGGTSGALWGLVLRALGTARSAIRAGPTHASSATESPRHSAASSRSARPRSATRPWSTCWRRPATRCPRRWPTVSGLGAAFAAAAEVADKAAQATADLLPRIGRARPHAEKSLGTPDAGAVSMALAFQRRQPCAGG